MRDVNEDFGAVRCQGLVIYTTKRKEENPPPLTQILFHLISVHNFIIGSETALIVRLRSPVWDIV
jgi:hypothetical protein